MKTPAQSLLSAAALQDERFVCFHQKRILWYSLPCEQINLPTLGCTYHPSWINSRKTKQRGKAAWTLQFRGKSLRSQIALRLPGTHTGSPNTEHSSSSRASTHSKAQHWGTQQHQTGRFSASFWKHRNLSGLVRRNTVNKKRAFFFVFLLFQMDGDCWGSICRTSTAERPCCLPPTTDCKHENSPEVTAAVTCSVTWVSCSTFFLGIQAAKPATASGLPHDSNCWSLTEYHFLFCCLINLLAFIYFQINS